MTTDTPIERHEPANEDRRVAEQVIAGMKGSPEPGSPEREVIRKRLAFMRSAIRGPLHPPQHTRTHIASTPDTELNASLRAYLKGRIELLKIRLDLRQDLERLADLEQAAKQGARRINERVAALGQRREYVAVGRLTTSSLYDGQRLPRMYRLQSVDGDAGRTVAYLLPHPDVDLDGKLGSIVGVQGAREPDANIRMIVLRPVRVDVLTSADDRNGSDSD